MPSLVTGPDVPVLNGSQEPCEEMRQILELVRKFKTFIEFMFDDDSGLPNTEPAREFGAIIFPPGTLKDIAISPGTSEAAAKAIVEKTWLTDEEITAYNANPNSVQPFWVMADYNQKLGAPDISGKFKLNADFRALNAGNVAGVVGVGTAGGSHEVTLTVDQIPAHTHTVDGIPAFNADVDLDAGTPNHVPDSFQDDFSETKTSASTGGSGAHTNMPPYYIVVTAWRTSRMQ